MYCAGGFVLGSALDQAAPGHQAARPVRHSDAYNAATGTAVLNGGPNKVCCAFNDTFTRDGTTWTKQLQ